MKHCAKLATRLLLHPERAVGITSIVVTPETEQQIFQTIREGCDRYGLTVCVYTHEGHPAVKLIPGTAHEDYTITDRDIDALLAPITRIRPDETDAAFNYSTNTTNLEALRKERQEWYR